MVANVTHEAQAWLLSDRDLWDTYHHFASDGPFGPFVYCLREIALRVRMLEWLRHELVEPTEKNPIAMVLSAFAQNRLNGSGDEKED